MSTKKLAQLSMFSLFMLYVVVILLSFASYLYNIYTSDIPIDFRHDRPITIASVCYFFALCIFLFCKRNLFWFLFPVVILTVPNAFNSLFPGVFLSPMSDKTNASFSFISHIDIFVIFYLFLKKKINLECSHVPYRYYSFLIYVSLLMIVPLILLCVKHVLKGGDYIHIINGAYQFRYVVLLLLIGAELYTKRNVKLFLTGCMVAIPLLFFEGAISTILAGKNIVGEMFSGNFANNVFGNSASMLFILFLCLARQNQGLVSRVSLIVTSLLCLVIVLMTDVRAALLASIIGSIIVLVYNYLTAFRVLVATGVLVTCLGFFLFHDKEILGYMYTTYNSVEIIINAGYANNDLAIDPTNSSMLTRIAIWKGTIMMILDNNLLGIGTGQWNYLKSEYGIPFNVLLDTHNDYLNYLVQYGVISGSVLIFMFFLLPIIKMLNFKSKINYANEYYIALMVFGVTCLTNANTNKHQVMMLFLVLLLLGRMKEEKTKQIT